MNKTLFLDLIERHYRVQLSRFQLQYFLSSSRYVAASCPRRGGKSFVAIADSLYTCTTPNKQVIMIVPGETSIRLMHEQIREMVEALDGHIAITRLNGDRIYFNNNSTLYLFSARSVVENYMGMRVNKVVIDEPDIIADIEQLKLTLECCMHASDDAQFKMIGTHSASTHNLKSYMLSPYFETVTGTIHTVHNPINRQRLSEMEAEMGDSVQFKLQVLNEVSPAVWNNTN